MQLITKKLTNVGLLSRLMSYIGTPSLLATLIQKISMQMLFPCGTPPHQKMYWTWLYSRTLLEYLSSEKVVFLIVEGLHNIGTVRKVNISSSYTIWGPHAMWIYACLGYLSNSWANWQSVDWLSETKNITIMQSTGTPRMNGLPVFDTKSTVGKIVVDDCSGHGRVLELLLVRTSVLMLKSQLLITEPAISIFLSS